MALFSRKPKYVQVRYHDLAHKSIGAADMSTAGAYTFTWGLSTRPLVGHWVWIDGIEGVTTGVVVSLEPGTSGMQFKPVKGLLSNADLEQFAKAHAFNEWKKADDRLLWLEMARQKAGFTAARDVPKRVPQPYETIPSIRGRVTGVAAKDRGRIWWRLYNLAVENGLPPEEIERFKEIADGWYERSRMKEPS